MGETGTTHWSFAKASESHPTGSICGHACLDGKTPSVADLLSGALPRMDHLAIDNALRFFKRLIPQDFSFHRKFHGRFLIEEAEARVLTLEFSQEHGTVADKTATYIQALEPLIIREGTLQVHVNPPKTQRHRVNAAGCARCWSQVEPAIEQGVVGFKSKHHPCILISRLRVLGEAHVRCLRCTPLFEGKRGAPEMIVG